MNDELTKVWSKLDAMRGSQNFRSIDAALTTLLTEDPDISVTVELLREIVKWRGAFQHGMFMSPPDLADFIADLAATRKAETVLDPTCGSGLLLKMVADQVGAQTVHGVDVNETAIRVAARLLGTQATLIQGDTLAPNLALLREYDLVVADPPMGTRLHRPMTIGNMLTGFKGTFGDALACWACTKLSPKGMAILIMPPAFLFSSQSEVAKAAIQNAGFAVSACIHIPTGSFQGTGIQAELVVIERGEQGDVFTGQYTPDKKHQQVMLSNLLARREGKRVAQGRMCPWDGFRGYPSVEAAERFRSLAKRPGLNPVPMNKLIRGTKNTKKTDFQRLEHLPNSVYIPLMGKGGVAAHQDELSESLKSYAQLQIDPEIADARFVAHAFNQELGQAVLDAARTGAVIPRIRLETLLSMDFYLPPRKVQEKVLESIERIAAIRSECQELEKSLWDDPSNATSLSKKVATINQADRYEDWIETLPFPLASILWRHKASTGGTEQRFRILLKFFEALTEFVATVHLSAFMADSGSWIEYRDGLQKALNKQNLRWDVATIGTWKCVLEFLGTRSRKLMNQDFDACANLYRTRNREVLTMMSHAELLSVLQDAASMRNNHAGHEGAIGERQAEVIHGELMALLQRCRNVFGRNWLEFELIQPAESRFSGGVFRYKVRRMVGTRSMPFETVDRESIEALDDTKLYLLDPTGYRGLALVPFVRVMPSPRTEHNACYFYNRKQGLGSRMISYHFEEDSDVTVSVDEIDSLLAQLMLGSQNSNG